MDMKKQINPYESPQTVTVSPLNHSRTLKTYWDVFLKRFLVKLFMVNFAVFVLQILIVGATFSFDTHSKNPITDVFIGVGLVYLLGIPINIGVLFWALVRVGDLFLSDYSIKDASLARH